VHDSEADDVRDVEVSLKDMLFYGVQNIAMFQLFVDSDKYRLP